MTFPSPSLTPPTLTGWQMSYQGLTFGAGQAVKITNVTGLGDLPNVRSGDLSLPRDHGELVGLDVLAGRDVSIDLEAEAGTANLQQTLLTLSAVTTDGLTTEQPLWFQIPNLPLLCVMCRPRKRTTPWNVGYQIGELATPTVQFHATDPRVYAAGQSVSVGLPNPTAGMTFPATFPISFGSTTANGVTVSNAGNVETRPMLIINGPVTNPTVQNASIAGTPALTISNPTQSSYTVLAGDQLLIDLGTPHRVLYYSGGIASGTTGAPRSIWVVPGSTWWTLQPGSNLIQFLSDDSAAVAGTVTVEWASAYMI